MKTTGKEGDTFLPVCAGFCGIWLHVRVCLFLFGISEHGHIKGDTWVSARECGSLMAAVSPGKLSLLILALTWPQALGRLPSAGEHGWGQAIRGREHPEWADPAVACMGAWEGMGMAWCPLHVLKAGKQTT